MTDGWCPFARQHRGLAAGPFGYPAGERDQNVPLLFVDHRMAGYKRTLDNDAWRHENWVGVHAGIGRDGSLDQYTNIFDASWGNGVAGSVTRYDRSNPRLAALEGLGDWVAVRYAGGWAYALVHGGVNIINAHTISTEHEDEAVDQPWTPAQIATSIRWKRWCLQELATAGMPMALGDSMLAGHYQVDAVNRPDCPGDYWPRAEILRALMEEEMTEEERARLANVETQIYTVRRDLNEMANGQDAVITHNDVKDASPKLSLKGLWYIAGKAWPF